jgi:diaminopimelate epimerase
MSRTVRLAKAHGLGNDFLILVDLEGSGPFDSSVARRLCDRHRGVGADGLIRVSRGTTAPFRMELRNADGGRAEISGNGARCVARLLVDRDLAPERFDLETDAGTRSICVGHDEISIDMGVPVALELPPGVASRGLDAVSISTGNPHVVVFVDDVRSADVPGLGASIGEGSTNVELAKIVGRGRVEARIWERGVGETEASGSGATAVAVAARSRGAVDPDVEIILPGGQLRIHWEGAGSPAIMTGPAVVLFELEVDLDALG